MGFPAGITLEMVDHARLLAGVAETRANTVEFTDEAKALRAETSELRTTVDYYLGHSHTKARHVAAISTDKLGTARAAVLRTLERSDLLESLPQRVVERLLTIQECGSGEVSFVDPITEEPRVASVFVPLELIGA